MLRIEILSALRGLNGTDLRETSTAVIDVFRASTTILCLMERGAERVRVTGRVSQALSWKEQGVIVIGERGGQKVAGFDLDNSPDQVIRRDWTSRDIAVTTSNGTRALVAVRHSAHVILAGFRNLDAAADHLRASGQDKFALIPIGSNHQPRAEDELCARALRARLEDEPVDLDGLVRRVRMERAADIRSRGRRFQRDVDLALQVNTTRIVPVLGPDLILHRTLCR